MATPRRGKPYIWVTYLSKLLGGDQCLWSAWFKSHFTYQKCEMDGAQLAEWNRDHSRLMRQRKAELEREGYTVTVEDQNAFKLEGQLAVVAGKPDLIGRRKGEVLIVDGKTGKRRDSDIWQVMLYLFAIPKSRPDIVGTLEGEVQYKQGDERIAITPDALTPDRIDDIVTMVKTIGGSVAPAKAPSRHECDRCNIGIDDCPDRFREARPSPASTVAAGF